MTLLLTYWMMLAHRSPIYVDADQMTRIAEAYYVKGYTDAMGGYEPQERLLPSHGPDWMQANEAMEKWAREAWRSCKLAECVAVSRSSVAALGWIDGSDGKCYETGTSTLIERPCP